MHYCGTDIIEVSRIKKAIEETQGFLEKVYTQGEIEIGNKKGEKTKFQYFAGRFAAKEAIFKAISKTMDIKSILDIEILNEESGRPYVNIKGKRAKNIDVSISHVEEMAIATATYSV